MVVRINVKKKKKKPCPSNPINNVCKDIITLQKLDNEGVT